MIFSLYSDGGSRGNPGKSGAGFVFYDEKNQEYFAGKKYLGVATNNVAEYSALVLGLQKAEEMGIKSLSCFLDSELIVKQLHGIYRVKKPELKIFFNQVKSLMASFQEISFSHVRREKNTRADQLANQAMDEE